MTSKATPSRRALFAAGGLAVTAAAVPAVASGSDVHRELAEVLRLQAIVNSTHGAPGPILEEWARKEGALLNRVLELPCTPESAAIKARVLIMLYGDEHDAVWETNRCTDGVLVRQIVRALTVGV